MPSRASPFAWRRGASFPSSASTARKGSLFSFLGVNGAGKSTTINILCSILPKDEGRVAICGFDLDKRAQDIKRRVGVVFQKTVLDDRLTVRENLLTRAAFYGMGGRAWKKRLSSTAPSGS